MRAKGQEKAEEPEMRPVAQEKEEVARCQERPPARNKQQ
jgi:hypothetical protein